VPSQLREAGYGPSSGLPYCVECLVAADAGSMKDTVASEAVPIPNMTANTVRRIMACSFLGSDEPTLRGVRDTTLGQIGTDTRSAMEWSRVGPPSFNPYRKPLTAPHGVPVSIPKGEHAVDAIFEV